MSMTSVMHLCGAAARDGGYAISQRVGVQDQPGDPLDDLFELQLRFGPGFAAGACAAACRRSRRLVACVCAAPPSARPLRPSPGVHRTAQEGSWRHPSGWFPHLGPRATYQGSPVAGHGSAFTLAIAPVSGLDNPLILRTSGGGTASCTAMHSVSSGSLCRVSEATGSRSRAAISRASASVTRSGLQG